MFTKHTDLLLDYSWGRTYPVMWYRQLWWRFMPGPTIIVKKPTEPIFVANSLYTISPAQHYGVWLLDNVGRQGWDWDWAWKDAGPNWVNPSKVAIKFRKGKEKFATEAALKWG